MVQQNSAAAGTDAQNAAAAAVFETAELLENILLQLPALDILVAQRVSRQFQNVFKGSVSLQKTIFLVQDGLVAKDDKSYAVEHAPFLRPVHPCDNRGICRRKEQLDFLKVLSDNKHSSSGCLKVALASLHPNSSCLKMFIARPAIQKVGISISGPHPTRCQEYCDRVECELGVKGEDVLEAIRTFVERYPTADHAMVMFC